MRVLARPVGRDNTGVHAGVKAGAHAPGPCFGWSKGVVHGRDGRDSPRRTPVECVKMQFAAILIRFLSGLCNLHVPFNIPSFRFLLQNFRLKWFCCQPCCKVALDTLSYIITISKLSMISRLSIIPGHCKISTVCKISISELREINRMSK